MKTYLFVLFFCFVSLSIFSQVGINTENPLGELHIIPKAVGEDPLILSGIKTTADAPNVLDGSNPVYSNLKISDNGVVRREKAPLPNQSAIVDLATQIPIVGGTATGSGGSVMNWYLADGTQSNYITLPETGAYVFSFRMYGTVKAVNVGGTHYISSWKVGSESAPFDIAEIYIVSVGAVNSTVATYSVNLTASGKAGDKIYFRISFYQDMANSVGWTLKAVTPTSRGAANKTSMLYWKL